MSDRALKHELNYVQIIMRFHSLIPVMLLTIAVTAPTSIVLPAFSQTPPAAQLSISRMGLAGIKLGTKAAQVQRKLGKPQTSRSETSRCCGKLLYWQYPELEVRLEVPEGANHEGNATVYAIKTKSPKLATLEGIRVGDRRSKVLRIYGIPQASEADAIYYSNDQYASSLVFRFENDRIVEISAGTQLN